MVYPDTLAMSQNTLSSAMFCPKASRIQSCNKLILFLKMSEYSECVGRVSQLVWRLTTGWIVRNRFLVGTRFSARPDRPWGPPSTMGSGPFPGVKCCPGVLLTTHPLLVPRSWKSRAIPLPNLWVTPGL